MERKGRYMKRRKRKRGKGDTGREREAQRCGEGSVRGCVFGVQDMQTGSETGKSAFFTSPPVLHSSLSQAPKLESTPVEYIRPLHRDIKSPALRVPIALEREHIDL